MPTGPPEDVRPLPVHTVEELAQRLAEVMTPASVIVCIGNELVGDDGAGCAVAQQLAGTVPWPVFDAQNAPESFLMKIVNCKPDTLVLVDALELAAPPGTVAMLPSRKITGQGPSTHGPAPIAFLDAVRMMHPCRTVVLGIQPEAGVFGTGLSEVVSASVDLIVRAFRTLAQGAPPDAE